MMTQPAVRLSGDLDYFRAAEMRRALADVRGEAVVDLSGVDYLDSAALTELAALARRERNVTLVVPSPHLRRILDIVAFTQLFRIVTQLEADRPTLHDAS
ncbi:MAG: STAS domain-containing protein [Candidatus Eremiobacteraeota bacterium]|nr:STAS domain-containing protein [Candidatus Eremiobacteraeota bacterium]